jgi:hypothetical protein
LFELLVEPLVDNRNFPSWSYIYGDISFIRIGMWIVLIAGVSTFVDKLFVGMRQVPKYLVNVSLVSLVFYQMESWLMSHGYRVYLESATANFTGFMTPASHIPVEVALAIFLYVSLIITFIRYWRIVWDNRL